MARGSGRPLAALVLSGEERSFLEAQVRRHRVARSMSDRCRMILLCADGLGNKAVAAETGVHEHTVGKWRRTLCQGPHRGAVGRAPSGTSTHHRGQAGGRGDRADADDDTGGRHPLVRCARWRRRRGCRTRPSGASGAPSACSRTGRRRSSCRPIRTSWRRSATLSASIHCVDSGYRSHPVEARSQHQSQENTWYEL